jgi:hypothetical protein
MRMKLFCRAGNVIAMRLRNFIALLGGAVATATCKVAALICASVPLARCLDLWNLH